MILATCRFPDIRLALQRRVHSALPHTCDCMHPGCITGPDSCTGDCRCDMWTMTVQSLRLRVAVMGPPPKGTLQRTATEEGQEKDGQAASTGCKQS